MDYFHADISSTEIPLPTECGTSRRGGVLIRGLVTCDMIAQRLYADKIRVDAIVFRIESVQARAFASECILATQADFDAESLPAIDHNRLLIDALNAARRKQEMS